MSTSFIQTNLKITWYDPVSRFMYLLLEKHRATVLEFTMGPMKYLDEQVMVSNRFA